MSQVVIQRASNNAIVPSDELLGSWAKSVLNDFSESKEVTLRIVDEDEMRSLNRDFRAQNKSTNVLSFPVEDEFELQHGVLGDVVICVQVVTREALEQGKNSDAHWAHMVMHGVLHLLGFDHINDSDAAVMEAHEIRLLSGFGIANPYVHPQYGNQHG